MEKSNQLMIIVAAIAILACTFWAGYAIGLKQRAPMDPSAVQQAIHSRWVQADTPPSPAVTVQGKAIEVVRGGYSWCKRVYYSKGSCVSVDSKYRIHCEWFLDQGQSDFYFTLKVT